MSHVLIDRLIDELGYSRVTPEIHDDFVAQPGMNVLFFPGDPTTVKDATDVGVLVTPWFMNLVLLPGTQEWNGMAQAGVATIDLPGGEIDFDVTHDDCLGTYLTAALFSSVAVFPDQDVAEASASGRCPRVRLPVAGRLRRRRQ